MNMQTIQSIYSLVRPANRWLEIPLLISANLLLVMTAYIEIPLGFSPVPITGQTFGVLLIAMVLGRVRGTGVVVAYLLEGAAGLPVFAGGAAGAHHLFGPTGGYLIGFALAAWIVGFLADSGWDRGYLKSIVAMTFGHMVVFATGLAWLSRFVPADALLAAGLTPFLAGTVIKTAVAAAVLPTVWKLVGRKSA